MRIARRLLAAAMCALAALAMCVGLAGTAWGEGETTGSITINNAVKGQTYTAYRIFDLSYQAGTDGNGTAYAYTVSEKWGNFFKAESSEGANDAGAGAAYVSLTAGTDGKTYVAWNGDKNSAADLQAFANAALTYAKDNKIDGIEAIFSTDNGTTTAKFSDLPLGYYVISSSVGAVCVLDTTTPDATINDKNGAPTVLKEVQENSTKAWGATNDAAYGDTVSFRITVSATNVLAQGYTLTDTMGAGLELNADSIKVYRVATADAIGQDTTPLTQNDDYTVTTEEHSFTIEFKDKTSEIGTDDNLPFVITYTATVQNKADLTTKITSRETIATTSNATLNLNTASIYWGATDEDNKQSTASSQTWTNVHQMTIFKYTGENVGLAGAKFELRTDAKDAATALTFKSDDAAGTYSIDSTNKNATLLSPVGGTITLKGLDGSDCTTNKKYYLVETKAPAGYNALKEAIEVTIEANGTVKYKYASVTGDPTSAKDGKVLVLNNTGTELPSTGGMGTTVIYVAGGLLVAAAVVLLVAKKKMSANDK